VTWAERLASARRISFDSNAVIYLLEGREPYASYVAQTAALIERGQALGVISTIVEMEVLVRPLRDSDTEAQERMRTFLQTMPNLMVRPVDRIIARRAATVRARTRLAPMDAIIVATALEERCDVIVGNDSFVAKQSLGVPYLYLEAYVV
jgi:predicted nucleic acid-binding protein